MKLVKCLIRVCLFEEETIGAAQSTSTSNAPSDSVKYPSLKELAALEREQESAELVAAMAGSCKIEDSEQQHSNAQVVLDPSKLETHSAPAAAAAAMSSTSTSEGEEGEEGGGAAGEAKPTESGSGGCSSASSRPSVAVSAVNLNVYVPEVKRLTDSELYVLCICLCIIRRERDLIMANRFDATEILKVSVFCADSFMSGTKYLFVSPSHSTSTPCSSP